MKNQENRKETIEKITETLQKQNGAVSRITIVGESGIGKTWLTKQVCERVTKVTSPNPKITLWLHLNNNISEKSLYETLASQISLFSESEEGEEQSDDDNVIKKAIDDSLETLKDNLSKEIRNKNLLLILDDEGSVIEEDYVMKDLKLKTFLEQHATLKTIVTRRKDKNETDSTTKIKLGPLSFDESKDLLKGSRDLLESLTVKDWSDLLQTLFKKNEIKEPTLISCLATKSKGLPSAITLLTNSLNSIKNLSENQKRIFKELILTTSSYDKSAACKYAVDFDRYNPVLSLSYELLKCDKSPMISCFWHVLDFYKYCGSAYYRDLIVNWILEGYFDPVKSVEKAYQEGHCILMEFMKRGILKSQEDNMLVPEISMNNLIDLQDGGYFGRSCLGFNRVYNRDKSKGFGKIMVIDDMMKSFHRKEKEKKKKIKSIFVTGNRLRREISGKFFENQEMKDLEVVVLFDPTFDKLIESLSKLTKLRVLVIRDCDLIQDIDQLSDLESLQVIEISGASSLNKIPDNFFKKMINLQSINLSGLAIKSSPSSIQNLSLLRCFIFRDCSELQDLPNFNVDTKNLEVIDIRGAKKLESYFNRDRDGQDLKGKNKNFAHLQKLEYLNFSETRIIRLPIFHAKDLDNDFSTMKLLTRIVLKNCKRLKRLPQLKPLTCLQFLDLSGSSELVEMLEVCLEDKKELRILNLSETNLPELADTIADVTNLNQLIMKNCIKIQELPKIEKLINLEVFDVSGCKNLKKIDGSFAGMFYLRVINLSGTDFESLPDKILELPNLKELILRNCLKIKTLPALEKLILLEVFDVSGCENLEKIEGSFEQMSYLREVNLAGTKLKTFPELPKKSSLCSTRHIVLEDSRSIKKDDWNQIKDSLAMESEGSKDSDAAEKPREESSLLGDIYKILREVKKPAKKPREESSLLGDIYKNIETPLEINEVNKEKLTKAEFVSLTENDTTSLSSIFEEFKMKSVKGFWVERCKNIENLFKSEDSTSLEILWISNLPLLKSLNTGNSMFKNLKMLSIDCCPKIKVLFPAASGVPENLVILKVMFCDQLERLFEFEDGELLKIYKIYLFDLPVLSVLGAKLKNLEEWNVEKCPKFDETQDYLKLGISRTRTRTAEEITEDQTQK